MTIPQAHRGTRTSFLNSLGLNFLNRRNRGKYLFLSAVERIKERFKEPGMVHGQERVSLYGTREEKQIPWTVQDEVFTAQFRRA